MQAKESLVSFEVTSRWSKQPIRNVFVLCVLRPSYPTKNRFRCESSLERISASTCESKDSGSRVLFVYTFSSVRKILLLLFYLQEYYIFRDQDLLGKFES